MELDSSDVAGNLPASRAMLSRERIIAAAIVLIDELGLRQLTMHRLGGRLGVEAMSLYTYVPSRESLLDGVVDNMVDSLYRDPDVKLSRPDLQWREYLEHLAHGVRRLALDHPEIFPLIATRPPAAPWLRPPLRSLRWLESFLDAPLAQGFSDPAAVAAYRAFTSFLLGHLLLEVSAMGVETGPIPEVRPETEGVDDAGRRESLSEYPQLRRLQSQLSQDRSADEFSQALDSLLDRLESLRT